VGKQRRKFEVGFKRQIVEEVKTGVLTVSAASRKYQISSSVIDRWRHRGLPPDISYVPTTRHNLLLDP
jgi:transposase-like protein